MTSKKSNRWLYARNVSNRSFRLFQRFFERSREFFKKYTDNLSVPFLLGFYITTVAGRWWQQYLTIPWPDRCKTNKCKPFYDYPYIETRLMLTIQMYIVGDSEKIKLIRRGLLRRTLLMLILLLRSISSRVRRRYPTLQSLVKAGNVSPSTTWHEGNL